jgi:8-oxo-dGTP diphosphatase
MSGQPYPPGEVGEFGVDLTALLPAPFGTIQAAGGVLWRPAGRDRVQVALVHRPRYDDWSLPKGKLTAGEHPAAAAVREIVEETGQRCVLGRPLPTAEYLVEGVPKVVHYWAARAISGRFEPNDEVDAVVWFPPEEALRWLTRADDVAVLEGFLACPVATRALIVLRHGHALPRKAWRGPDLDRPLRPEGTDQASALVPVLEAFGPTRVLSSPARRCQDTVTPLSAALSRGPELLPGLAEGVGDAEFAAAVDRVLCATGQDSVVVCSHRPVLPRLLRALEAAGRGCLPREPLEPGEFLIFHAQDGILLAGERHQV